MPGADVRDPEALTELRLAFARFLRTCDGALGGYTSELARVRELLRSEVLTHWRRQVTKHEEVFQEARRQYLEAEQDMRDAEHRRGAAGKQSAIDERLVMDRARRRREEAEAKLALTRTWLLRLDRDGEAAASVCQAQVLGLRERTAEAIARLERLHERLMDYLDISHGSAAMATPAPAGVALAVVPPASTVEETPPVDTAPGTPAVPEVASPQPPGPQPPGGA